MTSRITIWIIGALVVFSSIMYFRAQYLDAKSDLVTMTAERDNLKSLNEANAREIDRLAQAAESNARIAETVAQSKQAATRTEVVYRQDLNTAKRSDVNAESYLDQRVPCSVRRVLNDGRNVGKDCGGE